MKTKNPFSLVLEFIAMGCILVSCGKQSNGQVSSSLKTQSSNAPQSVINPQSISSSPIPSKSEVSGGCGSVDKISALPTPAGVLVYCDDFEDGFADGFTFNGPSWNVVDDGTGNEVLEVQPQAAGTNAIFGPKIFSDGVIEFRFKIVSGDNPLFQLNFRQNFIGKNGSDYLVLYKPGSINLLYQDPDTGWGPMEATSGMGNFTPSINEWISIRVEAFGNIFKIYVNNGLFTKAKDSRSDSGVLMFTAYPPSDIYIDDLRVWNGG
jgi:hypothetical protein